MEAQSASDVLMIRPTAFAANEQTRASNAFQASNGFNPSTVQLAARAEFDRLAEMLKVEGVNVHVFEQARLDTPDAVFPNNWVSFHADGAVVLYPMLAENRRRERRRDVLESLREHSGFSMTETIDLTAHERTGCFLEGTGSLVLDRVRRVAYACLSSRTHVQALREFSQRLSYEVIAFRAFDRSGTPIYHTNVMLCIGSAFAVVGAAAIRDEDRATVLDALRGSGREVIELSHQQLEHFAGNMLEVLSTRGDALIAMSSRAYGVLTSPQRAALERHGRIVHTPIPTIETLGGGSVRCMLGEIFLPGETS